MNILRHIFLIACLTVAFQALALTLPKDTVYLYESWEQMLDATPSAMIVAPYLYFGAYEVGIETDDDALNRDIIDRYIAATVNDSIWLINSDYLRRIFKGGDVSSLSDYVPVFFNDKVAYVIGPSNLSVKDLLWGGDGYVDADYYYIDFVGRKVRRVTSSVLSELLEDYHDLQMRYEGMRDYKKSHIIEDYFFKYIDRATGDVMHPYILELMGDQPR